MPPRVYQNSQEYEVKQLTTCPASLLGYSKCSTGQPKKGRGGRRPWALSISV